MSAIARIEVFPIGLRVTRAFSFASGSAGGAGATAPFVVVKAIDGDGAVGWGMARPLPQWSYETIATVVATLRGQLIPSVLGLDPWDRNALHQRMQAVIGRGPSSGQPVAKAALDLAVHDLCARRAGVPLRCLFGGGGGRVSLPLSWTCTAHQPDDVSQDVEAGLRCGMVHFNFKAAVAPNTDIAVARAIRQLAPRGAFVWADCNQGFQLADAVRVAAAFEEIGVDLLEQPFSADQPHLLESLRGRTRLPLAIDEACVSPGDFFDYARRGLVDYLVLKLTRTPGLWPSWQQAAMAAAMHLPAVVSGLTDGLLTKLAAAHLAAASGVTQPLALYGSQFLDEDALFPTKSEHEHSGAVHLGTAAGLGIEPDESALRALALDV